MMNKYSQVSEPTGLITVASGTRVTFLNGSNLEVVKSHSIPMSFEKEVSPYICA